MSSKPHTTEDKQMRAVTIRIPKDTAARLCRLKESTGFSETALVRQAIAAGLDHIEPVLAKLQTK